MKYFFTLLTFIFASTLSILAKSPAVYFESENQDSIGSRIEELLQKSTRNYVFYGIAETSSKPTKMLYQYKGATEEKPDSVKLIVKVKTTMVGTNPDLEIKGTPLYEIEQIAGPLLDVMPFWNILDPRTAEEVSKAGEIIIRIPDTKNESSMRKYRIKKDYNYNGMWVITRTW